MFGVKQYFVEITDDYGYKIMFFFNLVPADDQTPTVYEAVSTLNFTEGEDFDIGLVYDAISINEVKDETTETTETTEQTPKTAEIEYNKAPESDAIKKIILQNIDAWGLTTNYPDATFTGVSGMSDKYKAPPKFHDVTVTGVTFKYANDKGTSAKPYDGPKVTHTFRLGSGQDAVSHLYDDVNKCFKSEDENESPASITYKDITYTSSNGGVLHATITGELTGTTAPYKWKSKINGVDREFDIVNAGTSEAPVYKLKVNGKEYANGGIIEIKEENNNKPYTKYTVKIDIQGTGANTKPTSVSLNGEYTPDSQDSQGNYYLGLDTSEKETSVVTSSGTKNLATDALYWPGENSNTNYRTLSAGYYKVPYMDGWIYGTSDTTQVSILISLTYKAGDTDNEESCVVVYNANITKKAKFNSTAKVITDGQQFELDKYITMNPDLCNSKPVGEGEKANGTYYDDTLAVTIPAQGQVVLSVSICEDRTMLTSWKNYMLTRNNTSTTSQRTDFISISEIYGKTIDFKTGVRVSWVGPDGSSVYYATQPVASPTGSITIENTAYNYKILKLQEGTETKYKLAMIKEVNENSAWRMVDNYSGSKVVLNDKTYEVGFDIRAAIPAGVNQQAQPEKVKLKLDNTLNEEEEHMYPQQTLATYDHITTDILYIESAERIPSQTSVTDVYQYSITKSYIIKANGTYYQYKHNFIMTPKYAYFDNGLGQEVVKEIHKNNWEYDNDKGYTVKLHTNELTGWADGATHNGKTYDSVKVAPAKTDVSTVAQGTLKELAQLTESELSALEFTIGKDGTSYTDATINSATGEIQTGAHYELNKNQYILIRIWIKASGGPNGNFDGGKYGNANYKKLLGELRIYLTNNSTYANP